MNNQADLVSIVIPNWNGKKFLTPCLDSLLAQTYRNYEIIVVDNGSQDGSLDLLNQCYPQIKLLSLDHNTGFSFAVNRGIEMSKGKFIALVNNDTKADEQWLENMVSALQNYAEIGSVACKMLSLENPNILDGAGDGLRLGWLAARVGHGEINQGQFDQQRYVLGACGGAALYRKTLFDDIGLFDEDFFAYLEDVDLDLRAQSAGYQCLYIPQAIIYHLGCGTTGSGYNNLVVRLSWRNNINMMVKNMPPRLFFKYLPHILYWQTYYLLVVILRSGSVIGWLSGGLDALFLLPKMLRKRQHINLHRKVSIFYLEKIIADSAKELDQSKKRLHQQIRKRHT